MCQRENIMADSFFVTDVVFSNEFYWLHASVKKENCVFAFLCTCQLHTDSLAVASVLFGPQAKVGSHSSQ